MRPKVDAIKHRLVIEIKNIFRVKQTRLKGKEYLVKYKEAIWMKVTHFDHLQKMVNKFE
jgi:hypothetical protein